MHRFMGLALMLIAAGCTDRIGQVQGDIDHAAELACEDCYGAFLIYTSSQACYDSVDDLYGTTDIEAQCLRDVVNREPSAADYYDCILDALSVMNSCFSENNDPCENEEMRACFNDYGTAAQTCDNMYLTESSREAINECVN